MDEHTRMLLRARATIDRELAQSDPPIADLLAAADVAASPALLSPPSTPVTQRFVITSDPQYPRLKSGSGEGTVASTEAEHQQARNDIKAQYAAVNAYRMAHGGLAAVPVFVNGDLVEVGASHGQVAFNLLDELRSNYYIGMGNHDVERFGNVGDDTHRVANAFNYVRRCKALGIPIDVYESGGSNPFYQLYEGTFAYAKDIGDFCFMQLNNYPWHETTFKALYSEKLETKEFKIHSTLNWLRREADAASRRGKIIVLNFHYRPDANETFRQICDEYGIAFMFSGHIHDLAWNKESGWPPSARSGSAFTKGFLVAEYHKASNQLCIYLAPGNVPDMTTAFIVDAPPPVPAVTDVQVSWVTTTLWVAARGGKRAARLRGTLSGGTSKPQTTEDAPPGGRLAFPADETDKTGKAIVRVRGVDAAGREGVAIDVAIPAYVQPQPNPPRNLRYENDQGSTIRNCSVEWDEASGDVSSYSLYIGAAGALNGQAVSTTRPILHTYASLSALFNPLAFYRGKFINIRTVYQDFMSPPGVPLALDPLLDKLEAAMPLAVGSDVSLDGLARRKAELFAELVSIDDEMTRLQDSSSDKRPAV